MPRRRAGRRSKAVSSATACQPLRGVGGNSHCLPGVSLILGGTQIGGFDRCVSLVVTLLPVLDLDPAILGDVAVRIDINPPLGLVHDVLDDDALWPLFLVVRVRFELSAPLVFQPLSRSAADGVEGLTDRPASNSACCRVQPDLGDLDPSDSKTGRWPVRDL